MKKLKTFILAALTAVGACAAFGNSGSYIETDSTVWFDTASVSECSDYNTIYLMYRDSYDAWLEDGSPLSTLADASICSGNFADGAYAFYAGGQLSFTNTFRIGNGGDRTDQTASDFAILFSDDDSGYFLVDSSLVDYKIDLGDCFTIKMQEANAFTSADLKLFDQPVISAVSAEGWLDLTVGDRVAEAEETIVVDPAWGEAKTATVKIDGESSARTYTSASNDTWQTTALTAGRYTLALTAGATTETAAFWKVGGDWVVLDLPPYSTEGIEFQADTTYLALGQYEFAPDKTLTVLDGAKFEYGEGAGFKGGKLEMTKRYGTNVVEGGFFQIVEKIKGCADNPWTIGTGVEAYTNGAELVIAGKGTITGLSEIPAAVKDGITAITVTEPTMGVLTDALRGIGATGGTIALTLPDNWQGELPDEKDTWYGALSVELTAYPMAVKNVKVQQRYPWNGKVDVDFDLTGAGAVKVTLSVTVDGKKLKHPTVTGETTFDLGTGGELTGQKITWDAKADFGDAEKHEKIKVKLTVEKAEVE